ncbi:hypothetical protein J6590_075824 [Homalodisca vitripennis]|nr:hypothetical protein J6590_075824 [Homalodisca vitripennis]
MVQRLKRVVISELQIEDVKRAIRLCYIAAGYKNKPTSSIVLLRNRILRYLIFEKDETINLRFLLKKNVCSSKATPILRKPTNYVLTTTLP